MDHCAAIASVLRCAWRPIKMLSSCLAFFCAFLFGATQRDFFAFCFLWAIHSSRLFFADDCDDDSGVANTDGQNSRVHLALRSEHFRAMLYGGMRESEAGTEIEIKVGNVCLKEQSSDVVIVEWRPHLDRLSGHIRFSATNAEVWFLTYIFGVRSKYK